MTELLGINPVPFRYLTQYPEVQYNSVNSAASTRLSDARSVAIRRLRSDLDGVVATWPTEGGDTIRAEFEQALAG